MKEVDSRAAFEMGQADAEKPLDREVVEHCTLVFLNSDGSRPLMSYSFETHRSVSNGSETSPAACVSHLAAVEP